MYIFIGTEFWRDKIDHFDTEIDFSLPSPKEATCFFLFNQHFLLNGLPAGPRQGNFFLHRQISMKKMIFFYEKKTYNILKFSIKSV